MSEPLTEPRDIRKLLTNVAYRGGRIDGKHDASGMHVPSVVVRNVLRMAEAQGYSGEDAMTVLAYHALRQWESTLDQLLAQFDTGLAPRLVIPTSHQPDDDQ